MSDRTPPRKYSNTDVKVEVDLSPKSKENLRDALLDKKKPGIQIPRKPPSIAFDAAANLSPKSNSRLQEALAEGKTCADPKDCCAKEAWVDRNAKELYDAFADGRTESSTCGYSELSDRFSAKEGTTKDLRYTLTKIFEKYGPLKMMHKGRDALGRHWVSGWKLARARSEEPSHLTVTICVEKEDAKREHPVSAASILADRKYDADQASVKKENKE